MNIKLIQIKYINIQLVAVVIYLLMIAGVLFGVERPDGRLFMVDGSEWNLLSTTEPGRSTEAPSTTFEKREMIIVSGCVYISLLVVVVHQHYRMKRMESRYDKEDKK
jgi:hypothetical protein